MIRKNQHFEFSHFFIILFSDLVFFYKIDEHINEFCGQPTYDFLIQLIIYFNLMILIK